MIEAEWWEYDSVEEMADAVSGVDPATAPRSDDVIAGEGAGLAVGVEDRVDFEGREGQRLFHQHRDTARQGRLQEPQGEGGARQRPEGHADEARPEQNRNRADDQGRHAEARRFGAALELVRGSRRHPSWSPRVLPSRTLPTKR